MAIMLKRLDYLQLMALMIMVEIEDKNRKKRLFVPSAGAYYDFSLFEILQKPLIAKEFIAIPTLNSMVVNSRKGYLTPEFFSSLESILYYPYDAYEENLFKYVVSINSINLMDYPNNTDALLQSSETSYVAGLPNKNTQKIILNFNKLDSVYRFEFKWLDNQNYPNKINIKINDKTTYTFESLPRDNITEIVFNNPVKSISKIEFLFDSFSGQQRVLLREIKIY